MTHRSELLPSLLNAPPPARLSRHPEDERLGGWFAVNQDLGEGGVALIGFPCDIGVARNGGRPGAASAPSLIRQALARLTPPPEAGGAFRSLLDRSVDLGDVCTSGNLGEDALATLQERLGRIVATVLRAGGFPVVIGGGHETAFGHYLGFRDQYPDATVLNWDAHADVRPLVREQGHSGSPFRQILDLDAAQYLVAGLQPWSVSETHLGLVKDRGRAWFRQDLINRDSIARVFDSIGGPTMLSLDVDAVDGSEAPGVSAPSVSGFSASQWLDIAETAGRCGWICSADIVEVNPRFDVGSRTVRLAAMTIWHLIKGLSQRKPGDPVAASE